VILRPTIISPDSSHWAKWIDAALGADLTRRQAARSFHGRLLDQGKIPLLSWHHLEELLSVDSAANARDRVAYLRDMPMIAWMRPPAADVGLGSILDILAEEVIACDAGYSTLIEIRDRVRDRLLRIGPGIDAIGAEGWVWDVARPIMMGRRPKAGMITALSGMRITDESQTIGEIARQPLRPAAERVKVFAAIRQKAAREAIAADPRRSPELAWQIADEFVASFAEWIPEGEMSTHDFIVGTFMRQGLDQDEIRDECTVEELSTLATFRRHLRIVARNTNLSFERLKRVQLELLPSQRIGEALRKYGQKRSERPGSDLHDQYLAVLAAYTDVLYVDKRTHEDLRRVDQKDREVAKLFGNIMKASRYQDLAG
jgi:hypothetical protein